MPRKVAARIGLDPVAPLCPATWIYGPGRDTEQHQHDEYAARDGSPEQQPFPHFLDPADSSPVIG
jgi:hypothetical protein